jgi:hypothetical protein
MTCEGEAGITMMCEMRMIGSRVPQASCVLGATVRPRMASTRTMRHER